MRGGGNRDDGKTERKMIKDFLSFYHYVEFSSIVGLVCEYSRIVVSKSERILQSLYQHLQIAYKFRTFFRFLVYFFLFFIPNFLVDISNVTIDTEAS